MSSRSLPRSRAMNAGSLRPRSAANVARTTLWWLADPSDLLTTLVMPAASTTARTPPPAMMPVPSGAGFSITLPAPNRPTTACGTVVPLMGTRIRFFFAASIALRIAEGTSFALPTPKPTTPAPSPTTTSALKLRFLPPLTTFVTRLIWTTVSFRSNWPASIFSRLPIFFMSLDLQPGFARRFGDRAHAPVIQIPAAIEHHARHALFLRALRDGLANRRRAGLVAALGVLREGALERRLGRCRRRDRRARHVVDDLRVGVRRAAEHRETRTLGRAAHLLALPQMNPLALIFFRF